LRTLSFPYRPLRLRRSLVALLGMVPAPVVDTLGCAGLAVTGVVLLGPFAPRGPQQSTGVAGRVAAALPIDAALVGVALLLAVLAGGVAGAVTARRTPGRGSRAVIGALRTLATLPPYVLAMGLAAVVAAALSRPSGWGLLSLVLAAAALALDIAVLVARQAHRAVAGGLPTWGLALRTVHERLPVLLGATVAVEQVFGLPGLGQLLLQAALRRDIPLLQGAMLTALGIVFGGRLLIVAVTRAQDLR